MENIKIKTEVVDTLDFAEMRVRSSLADGIEARDDAAIFLRGNNGLYLSSELAEQVGGRIISLLGTERTDLIMGRDDSAHDVRFWDLEVSGSLGAKKIVVADKRFSNAQRSDAERELAAANLVAGHCQIDTFKTLFVLNQDDGVRLFSLFDSSVVSLDNLALNPNFSGGESDSVSRLGGSLGIAASTLARLHVSGIMHGDVALKNLATSKVRGNHYPFVIDLEDAKHADPAGDKDRYLGLLKKDISDLAEDLKRRGWLEYGDGNRLDHFSEMFLSHYLSHVSHPANMPVTSHKKLVDSIVSAAESVPRSILN